MLPFSISRGLSKFVCPMDSVPPKLLRVVSTPVGNAWCNYGSTESSEGKFVSPDFFVLKGCAAIFYFEYGKNVRMRLMVWWGINILWVD